MTLGEFVAWVAVAVVAAAIAAGARAAWLRRDRPGRAVAAGRARWDQRRATRAAEAHANLIDQVLGRAAAVGLPLPAAIERTGGYVTVTYTGDDRSFFVPDPALYERMLRRGQLPPQRTFLSAGPDRTVQDWTVEELQAWLDEHPSSGIATT